MICSQRAFMGSASLFFGIEGGVVHDLFLCTVIVKRERMRGEKNVYGGKLEACSGKGMARTGYTRSGTCSFSKGDGGSHHVCVDVSTRDEAGRNFCDLTGQEDWCSLPSQCHGKSKKECDKEKWCVCQWRFSEYVKKGKCDDMRVDCDATSMRAMRAYEKDPKRYGEALSCLKKKCPAKV